MMKRFPEFAARALRAACLSSFFLAANLSAADLIPFHVPEVRWGKVVRKASGDRSGYEIVAETTGGPGLLLTAPPLEEKSTPYEAIRFSGRIGEGAAIEINGKPARLSSLGSFAQRVKLVPGNNSVTLRLRDSSGTTEYQVEIKREVRLPGKEAEKKYRPPRLGKVSQPATPLQIVSGGARLLTLDPGTLLKVAGEEGNAYRVELSRNLSASVPAEAVTLEGTYPGKPYVVGNTVLDFPERKIFFAVSGRIPVQVEYLSPSALKVIFYNAAVGTSEINLGSGECGCRWEQTEDGRAVFFLEGPLSCYRWSPAWRNGFFELSWTGRPRGKEGRSVLIDPGHGGEQAGAVSPLGIEEKEANLLLARKVAKRVAAAGVTALLTREDDSLVDLEKRVDFARQSGADLLVSIHFNSVAEFENPREKSGFSVYHYHPPSLELARSLQRALGTLRLKDNGVRWKSLAVLRSPRVISALVEVAFLSNPEDESKIIAPDFLDRAAEAIASGILAYLQD